MADKEIVRTLHQVRRRLAVVRAVENGLRWALYGAAAAILVVAASALAYSRLPSWYVYPYMPLALIPAALWRAQIAWVPQRPHLFQATIADNIRLGRPDAPLEDVVRAAEQAHADAFTRALPQGYRTPLGDGAADLSGGQRQRLSLARLLLADKPVWLMDEPTSALDEEPEKYVLDAIRAAAGRKLIVISAHRAALVALADRRIAL